MSPVPGSSPIVLQSARALESLLPAITGLESEMSAALLRESRRQGYFRPAEERLLQAWFARLLTVREGLWEVIGEVSEPVQGDARRVQTLEQWRLFVLGFAAACALVRLDRRLVEEVACDSMTQRKLNEGCSEHRVPRKQFTAIFESLSSPQNAYAILQAMHVAADNRDRLDSLANDETVGWIARRLPALERSLDPRKRHYFRLLLRYGRHSLRRRGASARQKTTFAALETSGRLVAEMQARWIDKRVAPTVRGEIAELLRPGDVLVTRHDHAVSNLFLPGYWPHAALYIGFEHDRQRLGIEIDADRSERWSGDRCVLEALKDGVRFRPLEQTLGVDAVAVLRPVLSEADVARGITRVVQHEGKLYNFDFDFFRSDRLVCTEVVYRAFDQIGGVHFDLQDRAGRPTLSAEDLLDMALAGHAFRPLCLFGAPSCPDRLLQGEDVHEALARSYREH